MMLRSVKDLHVHYGKIHAVRGVSFHVEEKEIVSAVGANGAGKSTIMWTLAHVLKPSSGEITFWGLPLPEKLPTKSCTAACAWCPNAGGSSARSPLAKISSWGHT